MPTETQHQQTCIPTAAVINLAVRVQWAMIVSIDLVASSCIDCASAHKRSTVQAI
jgi:hypothetical protein